jgi:nucleoside permease NupC
VLGVVVAVVVAFTVSFSSSAAVLRCVLLSLMLRETVDTVVVNAPSLLPRLNAISSPLKYVVGVADFVSVVVSPAFTESEPVVPDILIDEESYVNEYVVDMSAADGLLM